MGLNKETFELIYSIKDELKGKSILSLGNPYLADNIKFNEYFECKQSELINIDINLRSKFIFHKYFKVKVFKILDISSEENADFIHNLNYPIKDNNLINNFDLIIDPGTLEHVMNDQQSLLNIFSCLKKDGIYCFSLPANCHLEHGFRQYSPTFFYDICFSNKGNLLLGNLGLISNLAKIDCLPLYKRYDNEFHEIIDKKLASKIRIFRNFKYKTGTLINLLNFTSTPILLSGLIRKKTNKIINFNGTQYIYRNYSLGDVTASKKNVDRKLSLLKLIKRLFIKFPFPNILKIYILKI